MGVEIFCLRLCVYHNTILFSTFSASDVTASSVQIVAEVANYLKVGLPQVCLLFYYNSVHSKIKYLFEIKGAIYMKMSAMGVDPPFSNLCALCPCSNRRPIGCTYAPSIWINCPWNTSDNRFRLESKTNSWRVQRLTTKDSNYCLHLKIKIGNWEFWALKPWTWYFVSCGTWFSLNFVGLGKL